MVAIVGSGASNRIPDLFHTRVVASRIQIRILDRELMLWRRPSETCKRLAPIPGVRLGPALTTALVASVADRELSAAAGFAAWTGLVPKQFCPLHWTNISGEVMYALRGASIFVYWNFSDTYFALAIAGSAVGCRSSDLVST